MNEQTILTIGNIGELRKAIAHLPDDAYFLSEDAKPLKLWVDKHTVMYEMGDLPDYEDDDRLSEKELAEMLNGRQYTGELNEEEEQLAKDSRLVIVFGASDDLMEFRGFIWDELNCYNGKDAYILNGNILTQRCDDYNCPHFKKEIERASKITALWGKEGFSWIYETSIPHKTFVIYDNDELYCRGIVFSVDNLK